MTTFKVMNPGILTTVQDLGRHGYQKYGLAVSGSADHYAHRIANLLVSNPENAAVLEVTLMGLKLEVKKKTIISVTGGDLQPKINNQPMATWSSIKVQEGDVIQFSGCRTGCRAYLAVAGGIDVPVVMGSRSTDTVGKIGGFNGRVLQKGDLVKSGFVTLSKIDLLRRHPSSELIPTYPDHVDVRVILGPQEDAFTSRGVDTFLSSTYTVSKDLDRMGCRLEGAKIEHKGGADIISEGNFIGGIQVPRDGLPIVFLVGRRSVGGYTKIAGVISVDLPKFAQVKAGNTVSFHEINIQEAHKLFKEYEKKFSKLKAYIKHK